MTRLVGSELLKLRTTRTFWGLAGAAAGLVLLIVVLSVALDTSATADNVLNILATAGFSGILTLVLGAVVGAGEYRHGTIAWTLLVTPNRLRAVAGQLLACAMAGLAIGLAVSALAALIALPWLAAKDATMPATGDVLEVVLGTAVYAGLAAALGAGLGALLRNQVAAIVIVLVQIFVVDTTLAALIEGVGPFTLTGLGVAMSGVVDDGEDLLAPGVAALVWAGYATLFGALAALRTARRDI
jgi:ABC-type transport system involved in multi-copper enzyme maturation permease subunit